MADHASRRVRMQHYWYPVHPEWHDLALRRYSGGEPSLSGHYGKPEQLPRKEVDGRGHDLCAGNYSLQEWPRHAGSQCSAASFEAGKQYTRYPLHGNGRKWVIISRRSTELGERTE